LAFISLKILEVRVRKGDSSLRKVFLGKVLVERKQPADSLGKREVLSLYVLGW